MADTFRSDRRQVEPLTGLVYEKTGGNPFFAIQFLKTLYDDGLVEFDRDGTPLEMGYRPHTSQGIYRQRRGSNDRKAKKAIRRNSAGD